MTKIATIKNEKEKQSIIKYLKDGTVENDLKGMSKLRFVKRCKMFILIEDVLHFYDENKYHKVVFHSEEIEQMKLSVVKLHKVNHYGMNKMESLCNDNFFKIPREIIRNVVGSCISCAQSQPLKKHDNFKSIFSSEPLERIQIDLVDLRQYSSENNDFSWLLVIIDIYSKFAFTFTMKSKSAIEVESKLRKFIYENGAMKILQCDNGKEFINSEIQKLCDEFKIRKIHGRPRHPQSQGQVERLNQTICRSLQKHLYESNTKRWIGILDKVIYNYNISIHSATKKSPFELFHRRKGYNTTIIPDDEIAQDIKETQINTKYQERMERLNGVHMNKHGIFRDQKVLLAKDFDNNKKTKRKKFDSYYDKPYVVVDVLCNKKVLLKDENGIENIFEISRIKKIESNK